jgi:lycopene beta-cyclase
MGSALFANADFKRNLDLQPINTTWFKLDFTIKFWFYFKWKKHQLCQSKVTDINELENHAYVATETDSYTCDTIFNSIYDKG